MKKKKNPLLIGCIVIVVLFLCCAVSGGVYWGYAAYQADTCYNEAFDRYSEKWDDACRAEGTFVSDEVDCELPLNLSDPLNQELALEEEACGFFLADY